MIVEWAENVNDKAYGLQASSINNLIEVKFESGKTRSFNKNSIGKKSFSFSIDMNDEGNDSEYKRFWIWYDTELCGRANTFLFPDLLNRGVDVEYRMTAEPTATGQRVKTVNISVEEV